jgi:hypothetical protein
MRVRPAGGFRKGTPRAILEVKSPHIPTAIYEARLRGYDEAKERSAVRKRREKGMASALKHSVVF